MAVACLGMLGLTHLMPGDFDRAQERTDAALALSAGSGLDEYWVTTAARTVACGPPDSGGPSRGRPARSWTER